MIVVGWLLFAALFILFVLFIVVEPRPSRCPECGGRNGFHDDDCASRGR